MTILYVRDTPILVDAADIPIVLPHSWFMNPQGYACTKVRVAPGRSGRRTIGMHRMILGDPPEPAIYHINRNKLDNRRANLRACSDSLNNHNRKIVVGKLSRFRGVHFRRGRWEVVIRIDGAVRWLGSFDTEDAAGVIARPYFADIID